MRLLGSTSRAIGDLVLVYKRVTGLAGHTSRVSELLERIRGLASADEDSTVTRLYLRWAGREWEPRLRLRLAGGKVAWQAGWLRGCLAGWQALRGD